ncbi:hypothetical protein TREMEDRAFT_72293 [Tremella mesenterica DSM 1558]|uniref:uncharacterized protein n=1 Tax=Tremella mesenterica (strain ATCC 24925 / CBS 8224 / DSM 1558 / NBRC 9311 / NRRL Y-6157 / RJB 2259-6 / UBC 559-6) TaxID=578456 RepID=UPI0003F4A445|nr:uncharacterized protein TREMEDRAFT_72293 [Tremella mesenterica DSM 1558]EIW67017.1 hypothetical protein TREMEDRAFT_72293 [Tremella mesenterica DSM 1558]
MMEPIPGESKKRVCYFFDSDIGNYHYGSGHPMKPTRIRMCHSLVMNYGLYKKMEIFRAKPATKREMSQFHTDEYVDFLHRITPENAHQFSKEQSKYNVGDDCPIFDGLFEYCSISAGGSMEGAARLSRDKCDIAVNWAGGLHHAKKAEASGFCYVNDIVLGILELLRYHQRVLYIDIDVHHGDGVEEAFYTTDRVMTASFHKYGEFFPGTGEVRDNGIGKGKGYAVNVPLRDGITDENYRSIFQPVMTRIIDFYQPGAIVLQCGADSLSGDRLGSFNLSMRGHAACVQFIKSFNLPLLLLGGGGYTVKSVSRTWAYETGLAAGVELRGGKLLLYYGPDYQLDVRPSNMTDHNTDEYLEKLKETVFEVLRDNIAAPSVQMHVDPPQEVPKLSHDDGDDPDRDMEDPDHRDPRSARDVRIEREGEYYDSDDEDMSERHRQSHRDPPTNGVIRRNRAESTSSTSSTNSAVRPSQSLPLIRSESPYAPSHVNGNPSTRPIESPPSPPISTSDVRASAETTIVQPAPVPVGDAADVEMSDPSEPPNPIVPSAVPPSHAVTIGDTDDPMSGELNGGPGVGDMIARGS